MFGIPAHHLLGDDLDAESADLGGLPDAVLEDELTEEVLLLVASRN